MHNTSFVLLSPRDIVQATDEFLDDDCTTWNPVEHWTIGRHWHDGLKPMRRKQLNSEPLNRDLTVLIYALPDGSTIERCVQKDGSVLWAIRFEESCLGINGDWVSEPKPSNRSAEFFKEFRYFSADSAYVVWQKFKLNSV